MRAIINLKLIWLCQTKNATQSCGQQPSLAPLSLSARPIQPIARVHSCLLPCLRELNGMDSEDLWHWTVADGVEGVVWEAQLQGWVDSIDWGSRRKVRESLSAWRVNWKVEGWSRQSNPFHSYTDHKSTRLPRKNCRKIASYQANWGTV